MVCRSISILLSCSNLSVVANHTRIASKNFPTTAAALLDYRWGKHTKPKAKAKDEDSEEEEAEEKEEGEGDSDTPDEKVSASKDGTAVKKNKENQTPAKRKPNIKNTASKKSKRVESDAKDSDLVKALRTELHALKVKLAAVAKPADTKKLVKSLVQEAESRLSQTVDSRIQQINDTAKAELVKTMKEVLGERKTSDSAPSALVLSPPVAALPTASPSLPTAPPSVTAVPAPVVSATAPSPTPPVGAFPGFFPYGFPFSQSYPSQPPFLSPYPPCAFMSPYSYPRPYGM